MAANPQLLKQLLRHFLIDDPGIAALVSGRVFDGHLADTDAASALEAGDVLIFNFQSGQQRWHGAVQIQIFELWAYSPRGADQAAKLYGVANDVLQHARVFKTGIEITPGTLLTGITQEVQRPVEGKNDVLSAWFARGRWKFGGTG